MAWTKYQKFLAVLMVLTGTINNLSTNWADQIKSKGSDGEKRLFNHPFLQVATMFLGEMLCLLTFKCIYKRMRNPECNLLTQGNHDFYKPILIPAALLHLVGTSIMYIGLNLTYPSSFQIFQGSILIFVGVFSTVFLHKTICKSKWIGIVNVSLGLVIIGVTDAVYESPSDRKSNTSLIIGNTLIVLAQIISAFQMVYEEKYVAGQKIPPLQAVGWEGIFGLSLLSLLIAIFCWVPAPLFFNHYPNGAIEDVTDGFIQISNNPVLMFAMLCTIVSIAFFNFVGISVTKEMSAIHRMILDAIRIVVIWGISLFVKWQIFHWEHVLGFTILVIGMCGYNEMFSRWYFTRSKDSELIPIIHYEAKTASVTIK